eukprot:1718945-Pyramimonas_sp.AAC.1
MLKRSIQFRLARLAGFRQRRHLRDATWGICVAEHEVEVQLEHLSHEYGSVQQWVRQRTGEAIAQKIHKHCEGRRFALAHRATMRLGHARTGTKRCDIRALPLANLTKAEWMH